MLDENLMSSFISLIVAVGGMAFVLLIIKKMLYKKNANSSGIPLKVISKIPLHSKTYLYIVKAAGKTLLIGASDHHITTLSDLSSNNDISNPNQKMQSNPKKQYKMKINDKSSQNLKIKEDPLSFRSFILSGFKKNINN